MFEKMSCIYLIEREQEEKMNKPTFNTGKLTFLGVMLSLTIVFVVLTALPTMSASMALLIFIPTIVTSIVQGPRLGAIMGFFAGTITLFRALLAPASPLDYLFINPLVAILPRIFIGVVPFYVYTGLKKIFKSESVSLLLAGASGALVNTGLVILALYIIYHDKIVAVSTEFGIGNTFGAFALFLVTTSSLLESSVAGISTMSVVRVYNKVKK
jgi:uncharacterized membrane protein